ncbi:hypothetical protein cypCar_00046953 [Cyprinus carpio]|nr:hypothetical protein cypCar_00046953 [Cyprinus carpio]
MNIISIKAREQIGYDLQNSILLKSPEENTRCRRGLYFQDGMRRVDYILTYHIKKSSSSRQHTSLLRDNAFTRTLRRGRAQPAPAAREETKAGSPNLCMDHHDDDKCLWREEFESNLVEMGLELERDEEVHVMEPALLLRKAFVCWRFVLSFG